MSKSPKLLNRQTHEDDRGKVFHYGSSALGGIQRIYFVEPSLESGFRGWHGHQTEGKVFLCINGKVRISTVEILNWQTPTAVGQVKSFELESDRGDLLLIPEGYANGIEPLTENSLVLVMSNRSLEESLQDDFRYPKESFSIG